MSRYGLKLSPEERTAIRASMKDHSVAQLDVADRLGCSQANISDYMRGHRPVPAEYIMPWYKLLGEDPRLEFLAKADEQLKPLLDEEAHMSDQLFVIQSRHIRLLRIDYRGKDRKESLEINWRRLVRTYLKELEAVFTDADEAKRPEIMADLTNLIKRYITTDENRGDAS